MEQEQIQEQPKINKKGRKICDRIYIVVALLIFAYAFIHLVFYPRSTVSETENRNLATFPEFSTAALFDGSFTSDINVYFSDTVPNRDTLTTYAAAIKDKSGYRVDGVRVHNAKLSTTDDETEETIAEVTEEEETSEPTPEPWTNSQIAEVDTTADIDDNAVLGDNGILVSGTRGLMIFGGSDDVGRDYAGVVNEYKRQLGEDVNVYCVVVPTSIEFYCPPSYKHYTNSELSAINAIIDALDDDVKGVDVYTTLAEHSDEDIYFRTDHHWAPLGAYYAAESFAKAANVDFPDLSTYEKVVKTGFVGTLYNYSNDIVLKNNPEDFVFYKPTSVEYETTYYPQDNMNNPSSGDFFYTYPDGSSLLYCTFMGGDNKITHVHTSANNGRRVAIFKDSYGNAFASFLINSFEDVYVIDLRYFKYNSIEFLKYYQITDVAFVNNIFHANTRSTVKYYTEFMTQ